MSIIINPGYSEFTTNHYVIGIDPVTGLGYYEHLTYVDNVSGTIRVEGKKVVEFDSLFEIPEEVVEGLKKNGYEVV